MVSSIMDFPHQASLVAWLDKIAASLQQILAIWMLLCIIWNRLVRRKIQLLRLFKSKSKSQ